MVKVICIVLGTISLGIGITGIFIPGLPTTPFVLLTAGLYARGSDRLYRQLVASKHVGPYIRQFQHDKGLSRKTKIYSISLMWLMILISALFFLGNPLSRIILAVVGIIGTIVMGFVLPTTKAGP
ncbi:MAG: YbaN family protein [Bacteroidales bacterium]|nr:YbaN family protein [Bacteroidales bacterium]